MRRHCRSWYALRGIAAVNLTAQGRLSSSTGSDRNGSKRNPSTPIASSVGTKTTASPPLGSTSGASFVAANQTATVSAHALSDPGSVYGHSRVTAEDKPAPGVAVSQMGVPSTSSVGGTHRHKARGPLFVRAAPPPSGSAAGQEDAETIKKGWGTTPGKSVAKRTDEESAIKTKARPEDGPMVPDYGPLRATGLWSVDDVLDESKKTVDFRRIDDVESEIVEEMKDPDDALVPYDEEEKWKHKLMFVHKFKKTPKHLTWKALGEEIECMDCSIALDEHRPEEIFTITFYFTDKKTGTRDIVWEARNDVSYSEGFTDLLAAVGACLGRSDVHRTIRFDDGQGTMHDFTIRKRSRYTSDITLSFRPPEKYNKFERKGEMDEFEAAMEAEGMSTWGFHPALMDPEYSDLDFKDPEGTYVVAMSAHGFAFVFLKAINRLLARPMKDFYRPSQLMRTAKVKTDDDIGIVHAMKGWMGIDEQIYPHYTPIEAIQEHWLGQDAPFSLVAIVNKLREMGYLKKENPEFQSWLSVRNHDTHVALRNMGVKLLGVGASTLFMPVQHNSTVNRLLPKSQQRRLESRFSLNAVLGLPDETRKIEEFKKITGHSRLTGDSVSTVVPKPSSDLGKEENTSPTRSSTNSIK